MYIIAWLNSRDWRGCGGAAGAGLAGTPGAGDGPTTTLIRAACAWGDHGRAFRFRRTLLSRPPRKRRSTFKVGSFSSLVVSTAKHARHTTGRIAFYVKLEFYEFYMTLESARWCL